MNVEGFKSVLSYISASKDSSESDMNRAAHDIAKDISSKSEKSVNKRNENHLKYEVASAQVDAYDLAMRWLSNEIDKCEKAAS